MSCEHLVMSYSTFSKAQNNALLEPMFFGQSGECGALRPAKYEIFEKLIEKQLSFFWRPEEIDVSRDRIDYQNLPDHEKHIFISNLKYQTLLDSIQGRSPNVACCLWCRFPSWKPGWRPGRFPKPSTRAPTPTSSAIS
jgi:ribonucleoside-diphosphate reductase beta chain